jgi:hypothetical protein
MAGKVGAASGQKSFGSFLQKRTPCLAFLQPRLSRSRKEATRVNTADPTPRVIFVQFKCKLGRAYEVAARLVDDIENTPQVYSTSGTYDLIARFHLDPDQDPGLFVTESLQKIDGVAETHTIIGFNAFTPRPKTPG